MSAHGLGWAERIEHGAMGVSYAVECLCGARWERPRFADAAVALERHECDHVRWPGEPVEPVAAPSSLPTGNRRRSHVGESLPSERDQ